MKKAFTILEVVVSVVILSVVGIALLTIARDNTKLISFLNKKSSSNSSLTTIAYHGNPDLNKLEKTLYDILSKTYQINSLDLKRELESTKILYKEELYKRMDFGQNSSEDAGVEISQIEIIKQSVSSKALNSNIYTFRLP